VLDGPGGFLMAPWCGSAECEAAVAAENGATIRVIPFDSPDEPGKCPVDGAPSERRVVFARAY
jgi:prolyl-tRNA synthetase